MLLGFNFFKLNTPKVQIFIYCAIHFIFKLCGILQLLRLRWPVIIYAPNLCYIKRCKIEWCTWCSYRVPCTFKAKNEKPEKPKNFFQKARLFQPWFCWGLPYTVGHIITTIYDDTIPAMQDNASIQNYSNADSFFHVTFHNYKTTSVTGHLYLWLCMMN